MGREREERATLPADVSPYDVRALSRADVLPYYRGVIRRGLRFHLAPERAWEDLEQDVLMTAMARLDTYDPGIATVAQWVNGITWHVVLAFRRKCRRKPDIVPGAEDGSAVAERLPATGLNPEQSTHAARWIALLERAVPERMRETLRLRAQRHTLEEIALQVSLSRAGVKERLRRVALLLDAAVANANEDRREAHKVRTFLFFPFLGGRAQAAPAGGAMDPPMPPTGEDGAGTARPMPRTMLVTPGPLSAGKHLSIRVAGMAAAAALTLGSIAHDTRRAHATEEVDTSYPVAAVLDFAPRTSPALAASLAVTVAAAAPPRPAPGAPSTAPPSRARPHPGGRVLPSPRAPHLPRLALDLRLQRGWERLHEGRPADALALAQEHAKERPDVDVAERAKLLAEARRALGARAAGK